MPGGVSGISGIQQQVLVGHMAAQYTDGYATFTLVQCFGIRETYKAIRRSDGKMLGYVTISWNQGLGMWQGADNGGLWSAKDRTLALQFTDRTETIPTIKGL